MERRKFWFERIIRNHEKKIWNIWKKRKLKSEKIGKIWKKSKDMENMEEKKVEQ